MQVCRCVGVKVCRCRWRYRYRYGYRYWHGYWYYIQEGIRISSQEMSRISKLKKAKSESRIKKQDSSGKCIRELADYK